MGKYDKLLLKVLSGTSDSNIQFTELCRLLHRLDFQERIKGDHHILTRRSIDEIIIYWSNEVIAFIAEVPGCLADSNSYQEALSNVEVIIKEWIDTAKELNRPIPEAKGRLIYA